MFHSMNIGYGVNRWIYANSTTLMSSSTRSLITLMKDWSLLDSKRDARMCWVDHLLIKKFVNSVRTGLFKWSFSYQLLIKRLTIKKSYSLLVKVVPFIYFPTKRKYIIVVNRFCWIPEERFLNIALFSLSLIKILQGFTRKLYCSQ